MRGIMKNIKVERKSDGIHAQAERKSDGVYAKLRECNAKVNREKRPGYLAQSALP